jgi:hypothetical protein
MTKLFIVIERNEHYSVQRVTAYTCEWTAWAFLDASTACYATMHVASLNTIETPNPFTLWMVPFNRIQEAQAWVDQNAFGRVGLLQANAKLEMTPHCHSDMRLIDTSNTMAVR